LKATLSDLPREDEINIYSLSQSLLQLQKARLSSVFEKRPYPYSLSLTSLQVDNPKRKRSIAVKNIQIEEVCFVNAV